MGIRKLQMSDQPMLLGEEGLLRILVGLVRSPAAMVEGGYILVHMR